MVEDNLAPATWTKINAIEGWLSYSAAHFTWALLRWQVSQGVSGSIAEFGVFKGKYLSLLAGASADTNSSVYGFDGFFAGFNQPLASEWIDPARAIMEENVRSVAGDDIPLEIIHANTLTLSSDGLRSRFREPPRFFSVDAGHEADEVAHDMSVVANVLGSFGIIAADDVFNAVTPGVAEGLCRYLSSETSPPVAAFATIGNKLFLTRTSEHSACLLFAKRYLSDTSEAHLLQSRLHFEANIANGNAPKFFGMELVPFIC